MGFFSAITGSILGFFTAYAVAISGRKRLQRVVSTASGVFANTGGVPLAFFFIAAVGNYGLVTVNLYKIGIDIYSGSFTLFGFSGLILVYLYFQIPLMVIVTYPAIEGLKNEWREAAINLGATKVIFWRYIGIPLLVPAVSGAFLLFVCQCFCRLCNRKCFNEWNIAITTSSNWIVSKWQRYRGPNKCWYGYGLGDDYCCGNCDGWIYLFR